MSLPITLLAKDALLRVARPRSPIFTEPVGPVMKILSHLRSRWMMGGVLVCRNSSPFSICRHQLRSTLGFITLNRFRYLGVGAWLTGYSNKEGLPTAVGRALIMQKGTPCERRVLTKSQRGPPSYYGPHTLRYAHPEASAVQASKALTSSASPKSSVQSPARCTASPWHWTPRSHRSAQCWGAAGPLASQPPP